MENRRRHPRSSEQHSPPADLALVLGNQSTPWVTRLNDDGDVFVREVEPEGSGLASKVA